ncbi:replication initiation protein [Halocynthiibacter namhaensis]|uniref:replication initiation protein n=1 Tax=Halocynthiibacter namhaensis TaxID=1290553 RepID=UPI000579437D|nr:replication initiation protein [Halocynthiibacter namhaensis]
MAKQPLDSQKLTGALRRETVRKNVAAIHISGKLSLLQRKLSNVLLLNAYDTLTTAPSHTIDARTLAMMVGYNSNDMDTLRASLRALAETVAEWDMLDQEGRQEWGVSSLLSFARLKGGVCEYSYSSALAEKLHDPKIYALINVNIQRNFSSGHGLALYENCYRFVRTGSTGWWTLDVFRKLMGIDDSAYYQSFKHLNAKIIKPAVKEVNNSSDIIVEPEFRKKGRAVTDIRFVIRENPQLAMFEIDDGDGLRGEPVYQELRRQGVSDRLSRQWIAEHGADYVGKKLDYVKGQGDVKSVPGYLSAALRDDYAQGDAPAAPAEVSPEVQQKVEKRAQAARQKGLDEDARFAESQRRKARFKLVAELAAARTPTQRDADKRLFVNRLKDPTDRREFERLGWESALNGRAIFAFWRELAPEAFAEIDPAEDDA